MLCLFCLTSSLLRAQAVDTDSAGNEPCAAVVTANPWYVDFQSDYGCWLPLGGATWSLIQSNYVYGIIGNDTADMMITSPAVALPADSLGLRLYWMDRRPSGYPTYTVMVSTGDRFDLASYTTLFLDQPVYSSTLYQRSVSLAPYAGDTVYIAFRQHYSGTAAAAFITGVQLYNALVPLGTLGTQASPAYVGDTVHYAVELSQGSPLGLTYTWHSSLLDSTFVAADSSLAIVYGVEGIDTMTVTVANNYGTLTRSCRLGVFACDTVSVFPWVEEFAELGNTADYAACWDIQGWDHPEASDNYGFTDEDGVYVSKNDILIAPTQGSHLTTPPIHVPATASGEFRLWLQYRSSLMATVSTDGGVTFPDTVYNALHNKLLLRHVSLAQYAGQTIRIRLTARNSYVHLDRVAVAYETVPKVDVTLPAKAVTDSATLCTAALRYGSASGLHYLWHSALGGTILYNALGDSAWITYGAGISGTEDIVTVTAVNDYGADSVSKGLHVVDCTPALALPWKETFADGDVCWYKPAGCKWYDAIPYNLSTYEKHRYLYLNTGRDTVGSWIVSKEVQIPSDTALVPYLFWDVSSSNGGYRHHYEVLVTAAADYTDPGNYALLYYDTAIHPNWSNWDHNKVSLAQYAGQTVRFAFRNHPDLTQSFVNGLFIDNVEVRSTVKPVVTLQADAANYYYGDSATFTATLAEGSTLGLSYAWHSTLLGADFVTAGKTLKLSYGLLAGLDTVTVVATNTFGADTAWIVVSSVIITQPEVSISHPTAYANDSTVFTAVLNHCVDDSVGYTWHSNLLGLTVTTLQPTAAWFYPATGVDTVTLVVDNGYGTATATTTFTIYVHPLPQLSLTAPTQVRIPDSAVFVAAVNECSPHGLSLSWHSTLLDTFFYSLVPRQVLHYSAEGVDTLTVILHNDEGDDTATAEVRVFDCSPRTLPYVENFEGVAPVVDGAVGSLPSCWDYNWNGSNAAYAPHVITTGSYQYMSDIPSNALFFVAGGSAGYGSDALVRLPQMDDSLQHLAMALDYRFESDNRGILMVGWFDGGGTYHDVKHLASHTGGYVRDTVFFAGHVAGDYRIALWWTYGSSWYGAAVDNIEVFVDNNIHAPASLTVSNVGGYSAQVAWSAVEGATAYNLVVPGLIDTVVAASPRTFALTGLTPSTSYTVRVAGIVDSLTGYYAQCQFTTLYVASPCAQLLSAEAVVLGARTAELLWQYDNGGALAPDGVSVTLHDLTAGGSVTFMAYGNDTLLDGLPLGHTFRADLRVVCGDEVSDTVSLFFTPVAVACAEVSGDNPYTYAYPINNEEPYGYCQMRYPATVAAAVDTLYGIALYYKGFPGEDAARVVDVYVGQSAAATLASPVSVSTHTLAVQNHTFMPEGHGWVKIPFTNPVPLDGISNVVVTIDDNSGYEGYNSMMFAAHPAGGGEAYFYYDGWPNASNVNPAVLNFAVTTGTNVPDIQLLGGCSTSRCLQPVVSVEGGNNSIAVSWAQRGNEALWRVEYRPEGSGVWLLADSTAATSYTIQGLNASSRYIVRVGSMCSNGSIVYSEPVTAATLCGAVSVPYYQNFLVDDAEDIPCWNIWNIFPRSSFGIDLYSSMPVVSPAIQGDLTQMRVRFHITGNPNWNPVLKVGVGNGDGGNATWLDSITLSSSAVNEYTVTLGGYAGSENHLLFKANTSYARLRDVTVESVVCQAVHHVEVSHLTDSTALLSWPASSGSGLWAVYLDGALTAVTTANSYALQGLQPGTAYTVGVRTVCGSGDTSDATTVALQTLCGRDTLPWAENFDNLQYNYHETPQCWSTIFPTFNVSSGNSLAYLAYCPNTASQALYIYDNTYATQHDPTVGCFIITPMLAPQGHNIDIDFDAYLSQGEVTVGTMTDVTDSATFVPLAAVTAATTHYHAVGDAHGMPAAYALAFRFRGTTYCYIDNLAVTAGEIPEDTVGIADRGMPAPRLSLHPNPTRGQVTVEGGEAGTLTVMDMQGRRCGEWRTDGRPLTLDLGGLPAGTYFIRMKSASGVTTKRLLLL